MGSDDKQLLVTGNHTIVHPDPDNIFKDTKNRWRTQSLFAETISTKYSGRADKYPPLYTLRDKDYDGLPSLHRLYIELEDPTGYLIANEYLGGWQHWLVLTRLKWFKEYLAIWQDELDVLLKVRGLRQIVKDAGSDSKTALASAKYLANAQYKDRRVGRPSKAEIDAEREKEAAIDKQLAEEAERVGLKLVDND